MLALLNNPQRSFLEIEEIINQLDSPNREIILLKFFEGFTLKEIALILEHNALNVLAAATLEATQGTAKGAVLDAALGKR